MAPVATEGFAPCVQRPLGVYPLVDRACKLSLLYEVGITTAQLRIKDLDAECIEAEIIEAIAISREYNAQLFINDYWDLALKHHAYGVHLGQEDLETAPLERLRKAGLRLGVSTHTLAEIEKIEALHPSYIAIGPLYETQSKVLAYETVGLRALQAWATPLLPPIVVIGGIDVTRIESVVRSGVVDGVAVISAIVEEGEISEEKTHALMEGFRRGYHG